MCSDQPTTTQLMLDDSAQHQMSFNDDVSARNIFT